MSLFENIKLKLKKKSPVIEKIETSSDILKEYKDIRVSDNRSIALGVNDFSIPTGICGNPVSEKLKKIIIHDTIGRINNNPIDHCIFCNKTTGYCFFAGFCDEKQEISNSMVEQYKEHMKAQINQMYGEEQNE